MTAGVKILSRLPGESTRRSPSATLPLDLMTGKMPARDVKWILYGANGYTGTLVAEEAARRGLRPVLSGRNREAVEALADRLGLAARPCGLHDPTALRELVRGATLVLHCAGPFSATSGPMLDACLAEGAHYLDITGEIDVFAACHARSGTGEARRVCIAPGVGFDVVPTDGAAAMLKQALPDATSLVLAFEAGGGPSVGTAKTGAQGLGKGGRVRRGGELVTVPLAYRTRTFLRGNTPRTAMTIPWGDVFTAFITTGIPDIEAYITASPKAIANARRLNWIRPLLGIPAVTRFIQSRLESSVKPPSSATRARTNAHIWGEATAADGRVARLELETPNGYELTVTASLGVVERLLNRNLEPPRHGYVTPSQLMGADYVLGLPGVTLVSRS